MLLFKFQLTYSVPTRTTDGQIKMLNHYRYIDQLAGRPKIGLRHLYGWNTIIILGTGILGRQTNEAGFELQVRGLILGVNCLGTPTTK
jgi:hypothetical protein